MVVLVGAAGSGAAVHGAALAEVLGLHRLSEAELLEEEVNQRTEVSAVGSEIADAVRAGRIVKPSLIVSMFAKAVAAGEGPWLLDGWPRRTDHLAMLEAAVGPVALVVSIGAAAEVLAERVAGRATCCSRCRRAGRACALSSRGGAAGARASPAERAAVRGAHRRGMGGPSSWPSIAMLRKSQLL